MAPSVSFPPNSALVDSVHGRIHADQLPLLDARAARWGLPTSPAYRPSDRDLAARVLREQLTAEGQGEEAIRERLRTLAA